MDKTITFNIGKEDKELIDEKARELRLSTSTFCRYFLLKNLKEGQNSQ